MSGIGRHRLLQLVAGQLHAETHVASLGAPHLQAIDQVGLGREFRVRRELHLLPDDLVRRRRCRLAQLHPLLARGNTAPGLFALAANRYIHTFGLRRETLAKVAVKNHRNGALNPKAHLRMEVTEEQVLNAPIIAWPFGLFDCCPTTDGAAAAIICRADMAKRFPKAPVLVKGAGLAVTSGRPYFDPTFDYLGFRSTQAAAQQAYAMAGIAPSDIDFAEVHDCFTWTEISNIEDLGFCRKGEGGRLEEEGQTALDGRLPINPSGGLKSFGHPIGASGVRMVTECVVQLRGEAGKRQVKDPELGLAHNVGGPGAVSCVVVLGRG